MSQPPPEHPEEGPEKEITNESSVSPVVPSPKTVSTPSSSTQASPSTTTQASPPTTTQASSSPPTLSLEPDDDFDQAMDQVLDHYEEYKKTDEVPTEKPKPGSHMLPMAPSEKKKKKKKKPKKPKKLVYDDEYDEYDDYDDTYDHLYY